MRKEVITSWMQAMMGQFRTPKIAINEGQSNEEIEQLIREIPVLRLLEKVDGYSSRSTQDGFVLLAFNNITDLTQDPRFMARRVIQ